MNQRGRFESNKGQAAAGAAVLLAVIVGLLVMFIILIPPEDRAELLGEPLSSTTSSSSTGIEAAASAKNLLTVSPGRIDYLDQTEVEHPLPVVNIFTKTEAKVLAEKNILIASQNVFSGEEDRLTFSITDLSNTENTFLSFRVKELTGRLIVHLNDEQIYNAPIAIGGSQVIPLHSNLLKDENTLTFAVSSPGLAFWRTNGLSFENAKIIADVTALNAQTSRNVFLVSETEKRNLDRVTLKFQPDCNFNEVGKLSITVNGREIYNAVPDCDIAMVPLEISPTQVQLGENEIIFTTERGQYLLSHVQLKSELQDVEFPTYYFDLSLEDYNKVKAGSLRVRATIDFVDVVSSKFGDIVFNGDLRHFDTKEASDTLDLSEDVVRGTNSFKLKPKKTLEIRQLRIDLVK